jgi:WD40 repeat protein/serine/threonine protein kinase
MNKSFMPSGQEREAALFALALEKPAAERTAFLDAVCGTDNALRQRLEALLSANEQPDSILTAQTEAARPTMKLDLDTGPDEAVGQTIGRYKLLERIGEGGCGVVYVAEQTEPVRRRVALKVIKLGMDTKAVVARFEAERQALAMMDHPNIAKVLDAGTTELGRPFFVMELVRGIRITDYCDQANLSTNDRLDLFIKVCQAIQHAHQKGIIHRDIKPSNILVTLHDSVPVPKVIDFGIAKATEGRLTDATVYTQLHQFIGTPAYMSPEQAEMSGLDIDTRSDIYSLGVLLYELLAGSTPFDGNELIASGIDAMRKTIREKEPMRPSTRLATLKEEELTTTAKRRSTETSKLLHQLRGDLDWIVMKCLEKDRTRRYEAAIGLAADLQRHLNNEPVVARPPSVPYRMLKFVRRNRAVAVVTGSVAAALVGGLSLALLGFVRERAALAEAKSARLAAEARKAEAESARTLAEESANRLRLQNYVGDMRAAQQDIAAQDLGAANRRLRKHFPSPGGEDLRGFEWYYLWEQAKGHDLLILGEHDRPVLDALFSPDGLYLVSVSLDGKLLVRRSGTWSAVADIQAGYNSRAFHKVVGFSPDGKRLVAQGQQGLLFIETDRWTVTRTLTGAYAPFDFSPDGRWFAAWSEEGVKVWTTADWSSELVHPSPSRDFSYLSLRFAPNSRYLAFPAVSDRGIRIWDVTEKKEIATFHAHGYFSLIFTPDSRQLIIGAFAFYKLERWDIQENKLLEPLDAHKLGVYSMAYSPDKTTLATCGADQLIHLWDAATMELRGTLRGHEAEVWSVAFSPNGRQLVTSSKDGTVRLWPTTVPDPPAALGTGAIPFFSPDSQRLIAVREGKIAAWRVSDGDPLDVVQPRTESERVMPSLRQHAVGRVDNDDGTSSIVDLQTGLSKGFFPSDLIDLRNFVVDAQWNLMAGVHDASAKVKLWNLKDQKLQMDWPVEAQSKAVLLSPDGKLLARVVTNYVVALCDTSTGRKVQSLAGAKWNVSAMVFSSDGKIFAGGSWDAQIYVWDVSASKLITPPLRGHRRGVSDLAFSPDGRTLISRSDDLSVRLWNVQTGQQMLLLEDTAFAILSPDARNFAHPDKSTTGFGLLITRLPTAAEAEDRNHAMTQFLKLD